MRTHKRVQNSFKISFNYTYQLSNTKTDTVMLFYKQVPISHLFQTLEEAAEYLRVQENIRMQQEVNRPNSSWSFVHFVLVDVNIILDQQVLHIQAGRLSFRLRHKKGMHALDRFDDELCLFRCYAVHKGTCID